MKIKSTLLGVAVLATLHTKAQTWVADSIAMGAGYANDVYYDLGQTGAVMTKANSDWHIAFQMTPQGPYGNVSIWANHVGGKVNVYSLHLTASSKFASLAAGDTVGKLSKPLYNADSTWNLGAFNQMSNTSNPFDFSWGTYDQQSHYVNGDSLYLVKVDADFYKLWVKQYISTPTDSISWIFRIAKFDGSGDTTIRFYRKNGFTDRQFGYYNAATRTTSDREPSRNGWDFLFGRYMEQTAMGPGVYVPYGVTGVMNNFYATAARAQHIMPDNATMGNYTFSTKLNAIGSVWKAYNMTTMMYNMVDSNSYFIKSKNNNKYYQLRFTRFDGSATGKIVFDKRDLGTTSVPTVAAAAVSAFYLAPNPAAANANIVIDAKEAVQGARILVSDITGKTVVAYTVNINNGMNAFNINTADLSSGIYVVTVAGNSWKIAEKLTVQH